MDFQGYFATLSRADSFKIGIMAVDRFHLGSSPTDGRIERRIERARTLDNAGKSY